uniref:Anterior gradient 2, protein disulphide isomerase family member n=1 Tax=Pundamilia nyererei TaxID=303518 RepID=A0A3B4FZH7_9CICH
PFPLPLLQNISPRVGRGSHRLCPEVFESFHSRIKPSITEVKDALISNGVFVCAGWGDQLIWAQTYEEGLYWSRSKNKPLLVIFHLEDCPHSQALKKVFSEDNEVQKVLDEDFIVLNLVYETTDKHLSPDGQYVPRLLFVDPSMTVRADITGRYANRMYAYEPSDIKLCKCCSPYLL